MADPSQQDDYLERVKAEIRAEAELARERAPLPRIEPAPRAASDAPASGNDGIDRGRLDYAIGELTGTHYRAFLDQAFRALLKRPPDDAGAEMQVRLLAAGASKAEILGNLRWSPEGRRVGTRVRGLLPRYALAKLVRVPLIGYFAEWSLALAGLPLLLRHQRAADTVNAARFGDLGDGVRDHAQRLGSLEGAHTALAAEHDRRSDEWRLEIRRLQLRVDELERQARTVAERASVLDERSDAAERELRELRHYVHATNHWVTSLQRSLGELDEAARRDAMQADALAAAAAPDSRENAARAARYAEWSAALAARSPAPARVLELAAADGSWLAALAAHGIDANGVEPNVVLALRARERGCSVAAGDALAVLAQCADAGLDGVSFDAETLTRADATAAAVLGEALRALKTGGYVLVRVERPPYGLTSRSFDAEPQRYALALAAAGFAATTVLPAHGAAAVLAQRP